MEKNMLDGPWMRKGNGIIAQQQGNAMLLNIY